MNLQDIWDKALDKPIALTVQGQKAAVTLRAQLYRYRERIKKVNLRSSGMAVSEYDNLVISMRRLPDGRSELRISGNSVEVLDVKEI